MMEIVDRELVYYSHAATYLAGAFSGDRVERENWTESENIQFCFALH